MNGLNYFRHDVGSRHHWKFKHLRKNYGADGWTMEAKFWYLNCIIAEEDGVRLNLSRKVRKLAIASELELSVDKLNEFLLFLEKEVELINKDENGYWTDIVDEIFQTVDARRKRQKKYKRQKNALESINKPLTESKDYIPTQLPTEKESMALINDLMTYFGFNETAHMNKYRDARRLLLKLQDSGDLEHFKKQWYYYKKYKSASDEKIHSWNKFVSLEDYMDGGWNGANWEKKYKDLDIDKPNNDPSRIHA